MKPFFCVLAAFSLGGCAGMESPLPPAPGMPSAFVEQAPSDANVLAPDWWRAFGSEDLSLLVAAAVAANPDLAIATERVLQAEAQARIAGASLFPGVNLGASTARNAARPSGGPTQGSDSSRVALTASYELDLWRKNASGVRAAEASLAATRYDRDAVRLTLVSGVAIAYFEVLSLRGRLVIARENLAIAERVLVLVESRARYGAVSPLDVARQKAAVLAQRAGIPPLELQERQTLFALAILVGRPPEGFDASGASVTGLSVPRVAPGLPSELLVRRPDLAGAEAQLAAANANITVARAALLPSIQLTGSAGLASNVLINVLSSPLATLSIGAALLQPIFDAGRLRAQVDVAQSRERELVENYRAFILAALADVEGALASASRTAAQEELLAQVLEQARLALRLAEVRYREGADDLLSVLDAQRTLFQAEDQLAQVRLARLQASVGLFRALGGGWRMPSAVGKVEQFNSKNGSTSG